MNNHTKIPKQEFFDRITHFKKLLEGNNIDAAVIYSNILDPSGVRYFSNFFPLNENSAMIIPVAGDPILCSGQACHEWSRHISVIEDIRIMPEVGEVSGVEYDIEGQVDFRDLFEEIKNSFDIKIIGVVGDLTFPEVIYRKLTGVFPDAEIVSADRLMYELRMKKSENEISCIKKAGEIISKSFEYSVSMLKPGYSEQDISADIQSQMLRLGAEGYAIEWPPMIQSGTKNSNLCMNIASTRKIGESEIIMLQAGTVYEGYNAALCTPVVLGRIPEDIRKAIKTLYKAVGLIEGLMEPGATSVEIFNKYRKFLSGSGYGDYVPYGPLHSIGMLECEFPFFSTTKPVELKMGMAVAIDAYLKDLSWGSFRIENTYIIGKDGADRVTGFNDDYIEERYF